MKKVSIAELKQYMFPFSPIFELPLTVLWSGTVLDILNEDNWCDLGRIWIAIRPGLFFTEEQLRIFADDCEKRGKLGKMPNAEAASDNAIHVAAWRGVYAYGDTVFWGDYGVVIYEACEAERKLQIEKLKEIALMEEK